ncbi:MAG TPA: transglycosylase SLT domain-containing protein [Bdellovibrionales bacterium]|nr:transglycosylase SLT domain-containing protein [Bdellovibrionales bacterium]
MTERASAQRGAGFYFAATIATTLSLTLTTADAKATRPLLRPTPGLSISQAQFARPLSEVMTADSTGLVFESKNQQAELMAQAKRYIHLRKGVSRDEHTKWTAACEAAAFKTPGNPFCKYEQARLDANSVTSRPSQGVRNERREIASALKDGEFSKVAGKAYPDVVGGVSLLGDAQAAIPVAKKVVDMRSCAPAVVSTALAYKIEELFPAKENVDLARNLYQRAVDCGRDPASQLAAGTAAFRLGLISIWRSECGTAEELMKKVESIKDVSILHSRAKYWRFQCATKQSNQSELKAAKASLLKDHPFSFQNLAVNGDDPSAMSNVLTDTMPDVMMRSLLRPELNDIIRGAEALAAAGSHHLAAEMIDKNVTALTETEPEVRLYVAAFLHRIEQALPKFKILANLFQTSPQLMSKASMQLMFPLWYFDVVRSKQDQVDPLLILSLIRQESAFNPQARSIVGARGLMQVMPATARSIASVRTAKLYDPSTNVGVGTKYFMKRLAQYNGDVELTLAAYNAGFARVDQWLKRYPTDNKVLFMDFIPFRETREYVTSILRNYYFYVRLYSEPKSASDTGRLQSESVKVQAIMSGNAGSVASRAADAEKH